VRTNVCSALWVVLVSCAYGQEFTYKLTDGRSVCGARGTENQDHVTVLIQVGSGSASVSLNRKDILSVAPTPAEPNAKPVIAGLDQATAGAVVVPALAPVAVEDHAFDKTRDLIKLALAETTSDSPQAAPENQVLNNPLANLWQDPTYWDVYGPLLSTTPGSFNGLLYFEGVLPRVENRKKKMVVPQGPLTTIFIGSRNTCP